MPMMGQTAIREVTGVLCLASSMLKAQNSNKRVKIPQKANPNLRALSDDSGYE